MSKIKIVGISGTNGAGKDSVGHTLALKHKFLFVSITDLLREEAKRREIPIERENLRMISAEWRRQYGLGVLVDRAYDLFKELEAEYSGLAISSLRNPAEADRVHELGGVVVWVDANPRTRYERIQKNLEERGRSAEDMKTYEQFLLEEQMEMHIPPGGDAANLDMTAVKQRADILLLNDGTDIIDFQKFIDVQLFGVEETPEAK
jgi:cytidylate kinase